MRALQALLILAVIGIAMWARGGSFGREPLRVAPPSALLFMPEATKPARAADGLPRGLAPMAQPTDAPIAVELRQVLAADRSPAPDGSANAPTAR